MKTVRKRHSPLRTARLNARRQTKGITKTFVLQQIRSIRAHLRKLKVKELYLFGSVARDEASAHSDIDVLVSFSGPVDLFDLSDLKQLLQEHLGTSVDIVMREALRDEFKAQVEREMIRAA